MARRESASARSAGELELVRRIRAQVGRDSGPGVALGIGDDCALLRVRPDEEIAVTTDLSIEGRHFRLDWHEPEAVGHRALARGLSDLAAMGARPVAAFVSLGVRREMSPPSHPSRKKRAMDGAQADSALSREEWVRRFYDGLLKLAHGYKTPLAGGDLAESPVVLADIVLVGAVPRGKALRRSGARAGDAIYVTGKLGAAAAGLARLQLTADSSQNESSQFTVRSSPQTGEKLLVRAHLYPQPRVAQGLWLRRRGAATAAIDLSDGLSTDLRHICEESKLAAEVDETVLPVAAGATLEQALHGGEDYELLFTAAKGTRIPRTIAGVGVTKIGRMVRRRRGRALVTLKGANGSAHALEARGWEHFT